MLPKGHWNIFYHHSFHLIIIFSDWVHATDTEFDVIFSNSKAWAPFLIPWTYGWLCWKSYVATWIRFFSVIIAVVMNRKSFKLVCRCYIVAIGYIHFLILLFLWLLLKLSCSAMLKQPSVNLSIIFMSDLLFSLKLMLSSFSY